MRLWSIHPRYLDAHGLTALWREALLAQAVVRGRTKGYRAHPQLQRFLTSGSPRGSIAAYLRGVWDEANARGYRFERRLIEGRASAAALPVSREQVQWEWRHLLAKLERRSPAVHRSWRGIRAPVLHPLFRPVPGPIAEWERGRRPAG